MGLVFLKIVTGLQVLLVLFACELSMTGEKVPTTIGELKTSASAFFLCLSLRVLRFVLYMF